LGDYWTFRDGEDYLLFDAGPVGPDSLPAHSHADLMSFEASIHRRRIFVDSGVFNYQDDPMRQYCRSSRAHNVLGIDGHDQCDMWSRFRMGYRGRPIGFSCGSTQKFHWARAAHNAYRRLGVPVVGRWIACRPGGPWLCLDWARGHGSHRLMSRLHLHPDVLVEKTDIAVFLKIDEYVLTLNYLTPGTICLSDGWYCSEFGTRQPTRVLTWEARGTLPAWSGWSLVWGSCDGSATLDVNDQKEPRVTWHERGTAIRLDPTSGFSY
jgi:hypothetical protein